MHGYGINASEKYWRKIFCRLRMQNIQQKCIQVIYN